MASWHFPPQGSATVRIHMNSGSGPSQYQAARNRCWLIELVNLVSSQRHTVQSPNNWILNFISVMHNQSQHQQLTVPTSLVYIDERSNWRCQILEIPKEILWNIYPAHTLLHDFAYSFQQFCYIYISTNIVQNYWVWYYHSAFYRNRKAWNLFQYGYVQVTKVYKTAHYFVWWCKWTSPWIPPKKCRNLLRTRQILMRMINILVLCLEISSPNLEMVSEAYRYIEGIPDTFQKSNRWNEYP